MRDLRLTLDDQSFTQLAETARALIPTLAPTWTDHNVHDPGITLLDLVAWSAEAQIYSLGRLRRDERIAYAALSGVQPRGPVPASGLIWPTPSVQPTSSIALAAGNALRAERNDTQPLSLAQSIFVTGARFTHLTATLANGELRDWTRVNAQEGASFAPFGDAATARAVLRLQFNGRLCDQDSIPAGHWLALGIRLVESGSAAVHVAARPGALVAMLEARGQRWPLPIRVDGTHGLLHTGVLLLDLAEVPPATRDFSITLASSGGELVRAPQFVRIAPNVLPVAARTLVQEDESRFGTGLPDQLYRLRQGGLMFGPDTAAPSVEVGAGEPWRATTDLSQAGPGERVFVLDPMLATLRFGNGVNGAVPPLGADLRVGYSVSSGVRGNVTRGVTWQVVGVGALVGSNVDALSGGADASTLEDLQRAARLRGRTEFPLVTARDLEQAALALRDLRVNRARELPSGRAQCGHPELDGVRTLVVVAERTATTPAGVLLENVSWLQAIQQQLAPRLPLGQRLRVVAPRLLPLRVRARLRALPQVDPQVLQAAAEAELLRRLSLAAPSGWPFERDVERLDVQGWLRKLPGVASVTALELLLADQPINGAGLEISGRALPEYRAGGDIVIERFTGARR